MSIKKIDRADGTRYQVYGQRDGRKVYLATYGTRKEAIGADEEHRTVQRKIAKGELAPEHDQRRTFRDAVAAWLKSIEIAGSRSHDQYKWRADTYLLPTFGDVPLASIRKPSVLQWRDDMSERVGPSSVNTILGTLSAAFSHFVEHGWIEVNPCAKIKRLKVDARVFPWLQSTEAITRLLSHCPDNIRTIIAVLVGTGLRIDEALHLRWDDIDLEHRIITVHRGGKGTTKSGKARRVPIFDSVLGVLKQMKLARGGGALLWTSKQPRFRRRQVERPLHQESVRKPFKEAAKEAGLPPDLRVHDLRHTFASLFLVDGGDIFKLSRILGHHSVVITERTYAHLKPTAFEDDYKRVAFRMPTEARVVAICAT